MKSTAFAFSAVALSVTLTARAEVRLPAVFGDHMVLQQNVNVPVWGTAEPGEQVTVTLEKQKLAATADAQGRWRVALAPLTAGGPFEMTVAGKNTITLRKA